MLSASAVRAECADIPLKGMWAGKGLRTGHRGQPILATKPTTAEPTAVDPGTARAKRMVMAGAYATAGTARAKRVVMAVSHAMVASRIGWQSPSADGYPPKNAPS